MLQKHSCSPENGVRHPESLGMILTSTITGFKKLNQQNIDLIFLTNLTDSALSTQNRLVQSINNSTCQDRFYLV